VMGVGGEARGVSTGTLAEDDLGARRDFEAEALRADGHAAQHGTFFLFGGVPSGLGFHAQLPVGFVLVAVAAHVANVRVGLVEVGDLLAGEAGGQPVLPELMFAFTLAPGLGRGRVTEAHAAEVERLGQLREGVGDMGEEEGMEVHVEFQRPALFQERGGEKIVIGQEGFTFVNPDFGCVKWPGGTDLCTDTLNPW